MPTADCYKCNVNTDRAAAPFYYLAYIYLQFVSRAQAAVRHMMQVDACQGNWLPDLQRKFSRLY
eukprot:365429-Chlamydomonas_euryale.AAC.12